MATHSSVLAWRIPGTEKPGGLQWDHKGLDANGNPLQCSCLENPRDRGSWGAAVYGVAQSRTRLKRLSMHAYMHWGREWQPTPVFLHGESQGQRSLVGFRLQGRTELDTTNVT